MYIAETTVVLNCSHWLTLGYKCPDTDQHGHTLSVTIRVAAEKPNEFGLLADFRAIESAIKKLDYTAINKTEPFGQTNPTLENMCFTFSDWVMNVLELESNQPLVYEIEIDDGVRKVTYRPDYEGGEDADR
jgi:6-pyruvoyl-tetrahydropterin synthase